ncbi:MAG TPA: hypothetical protein VF596_18760 [Pyrinomonadaceae bacterium]|jgi:hypothetical protein
MSDIKFKDEITPHERGNPACPACLDRTDQNFPTVCLEPDCTDGLVHGEKRYDQDAGGETVYVIRRCDSCNFAYEPIFI